MTSKNEVILTFPGRFGAPHPQIPLSLLYIAGSLLKNRFRVRIVDLRVEKVGGLKLGDPLFIGISCMSGLQIGHGIDFARLMRESNPSSPLVWGGVHPSILPNQTIANGLVDVVVRGEGEGAAVEIAERLNAGAPLEGIKGITYKEGGSIRHAQDREPPHLDSLPIELPFYLLKIEKYPSLGQGRFHIQTSRGCPHRCTFCYNTAFNGCRWRGKSPTRVLEEMQWALRHFRNLKIFDIIDDNYFVDTRRVEEICKGMIERGLGKSWRADCRFDYMSRYEKDFLSLLEKSGCVELNFGAETGSKKLLASIKKDVTPEQMMTSVKKMRECAPSISPYVFWMSGFPGETREDLEETFTLMDTLSKLNPREQNIEVCIFTPYPSPMHDTLPPQYIPPQTLEEWGREDVFHFRPPWHSTEYVDLLRNVSIVTRYAFSPDDRLREHGALFRAGYRAVNWVARYRWRHRKFARPIELDIVSGLARRLRGF